MFMSYVKVTHFYLGLSMNMGGAYFFFFWQGVRFKCLHPVKRPCGKSITFISLKMKSIYFLKQTNKLF